jgi:hypothetical protein
MVVENLWKHLKRRDLAQFNRPRLDLVTHLVISTVLPRVQLTLDCVLERRRIGRAKALASWQTAFKHQWIEMSASDEQRLVRKELAIRKGNLTGKAREERLAQIAAEEARDHGTHHTNVEHWTCSCLSYLTSRFLLCKHLVRQVNFTLKDRPLTSLAFFAKLSRARSVPFYSIPGIHTPESGDTDSEDGQAIEIHLLGGHSSRSRSSSSRSASAQSEDGGDLGEENNNGRADDKDSDENDEDGSSNDKDGGDEGDDVAVVEDNENADNNRVRNIKLVYYWILTY